MSRLTKGEQFIHDWQYGMLGDTSFMGYLAKAMAVADSQNLTALWRGFPSEAEAMDNFHHKKGWWEMVQDKHDANNPFDITDGRSPQTRVATIKEE